MSSLVTMLLLQGTVPVSASPSPSYTPGVSPGDWVTYGNVTGSWQSPLPPTPPFSDFEHADWISTNVDAVSGTEVTVTQTWNLNNGTGTRDQTLVGNVTSGVGNLSIWVIAGGLSEGDRINTGSVASPTLNSTMIKAYLGTARSVNVLNVTTTFIDSPTKITVKGTSFWDQATGVLLEVSFDLEVSFCVGALCTPTATGSGYAIITETNLWTTGQPPDFTVNANPEQLTIVAGSSASTVLSLTSRNEFSGTITLSASPPAGVAVDVDPDSLSLTPNHPETATVTMIADPSAPQGAYSIDVTAASESLSRIVEIGITVQQAPSFSLNLEPAALSLQAGDTGTSTLRIIGENGFSGTVSLSVNAPLGIIASVDPATMAGSGTATLTINVSRTLNAGTYIITLNASQGSVTRTASLTLTVASPPTPSIFGVDLSLFYGVMATVVVALISGVLLARSRLLSKRTPPTDNA